MDSGPHGNIGGNQKDFAHRALLSHSYEHDRVRSFLVFLKSFLYVNNAEINRIFDEQLMQLSGTIKMGVIEIVKKQEREEGRQEVKKEVVESLILELNITDEQAARIARVTVDFVRKIRKDLDT